ncbi:hypothetical protein CS369_13400 [Candidatus Symbiopectobacterium sp. 'North America']|nr:BMC domain-containing protein [Candidatus Symbiopectobacterium sp. 'North America']MBG6245522.1 hypothetical protein [Candidatus Symbiopectobacterium sp. 'North America']
MAKQSLGLIETVGLAAAVEAADAAVKSANVNLVGYELTKGGGMVTVKLEGEVGAVNAAIAAASVAAAKVGQVYAHKVITRTAEGIEAITHSAETIGVARPEPLAPEVVITPPAAPESETKATTIPVVTLSQAIMARHSGISSSSQCVRYNRLRKRLLCRTLRHRQSLISPRKNLRHARRAKTPRVRVTNNHDVISLPTIPGNRRGFFCSDYGD